MYWDSCVWSALIGNETAVPLGGGTVENRAALARAVVDDAGKGAVEIVTSALTLAEVSRISNDAGGPAPTEDKLAAFFESEFIIVSALDRSIGEGARKLMQARYPGLRPLDAVHVTSAQAANVDEMHTFDQDVLKLNGRLARRDGKRLVVCKPSMGGPPLPLLEPPQNELDQTSEGGES